ncbi:MAG: phage tail tape measure protein [Bacteroidales bacterium]|nr:phage tail tape measure protein [Bacteroidales bacterium]
MAKTIRDEDLRLNIIVNGEKGRKELLESEKEIKRLTDLQRDYNAQIKAMEKDGSFKIRQQGYANLKKASEQATTALQKEQQRHDSLTRQLKVETMTMSELSRHIKLTNIALRNAVPGTENWKRLNNELKVSKLRMQELSSQSKATEGALQRIMKLRGGAIAAIGVVTGMVRGIGRGFDIITDFEQANANLSTIIGKNVDEIGDLTRSARELGGSTEYTASQVTYLQTELAKLGFKEKDILNMQEAVLHFATAVGADLSEAAALTGATLRIFDLDSSRTEDTLGVLTKATTNSALSFDYLQTAMSIVGPVAKTFGFSVRDVTALLGTLANSGFDASSAATATRNILLNLADANGKLATALGGPVTTLPELIDGLKKLDSQGVDLATTLELTDKRSVSAFNSFLKGADDVDTLRESLEDVKDVLGDTAEARMNTVQGSIKLLKSAWEEFILSMSKGKGVIKDTIDLLTTFIQKITPKQKDSGLGDARAQGEGLMASYWNSAVTEEARDEILKDINHQIDEARKVLEGREKGFTNVIGRRQKKQAEKRIAEARHNVEMLEAAREDYFNRVKWENGAFYEDANTATNTGGKNGPGGAGKAKSSGSKVDPVKEARKVLDELIKQQEDYQKQSEQLAKDGVAIIAAAETDTTKAALIQENVRHQEELKKFKEAAVDYEDKSAIIEAIEKKHQINLAKIRQEAFDRELSDLERKHNREKQQEQNEYLSKLTAKGGNNWQANAITKEMQEVAVKSDLAYMKTLEQKLRSIVETGQIDGIDIPKEELDKLKLKLEQTIGKVLELTAQDKKNSAGIFGGTGQGSLFGVSEEQWGQFFHNLDNSKLKAEDLVNIMSGLGNVASEGFKLASQAISNTNAKEAAAFKEYQKNQEKEKNALQDRLDSGLMSQAQYDAEVKRMEEEAEARQEEMQLKQAKREKQMNLIQAIINTALGVTKTLAQWGIPAGLAPAAIMSAMGAAQVALIASQPVTGAEEGGYVNTRRKQDGKSFRARLSPDQRGFINSPTVLVGENGGEYVVPAAGLDNPTLRPILATIESARKSGRLKDLNFEAVYPVTSSFGREAGGYVSEAAGETLPNVAKSASQETPTRLIEIMARLESVLSRGIKAEVSMLGRNGIVEQTEKYQRAKQRGAYNNG